MIICFDNFVLIILQVYFVARERRLQERRIAISNARELFLLRRVKMAWLQDNPRWDENLQCYVNDQNVPIIYVDGSCIGNGSPNAKSGVGIWISENEGYS